MSAGERIVVQGITAKEPFETVPEDFHRVRTQGLWPGASRDLWTDAMGVLCLLNVHVESGEGRPLAEAEWVAREVDRVLGRRRGITAMEGPDERGQAFRSLVLWIFALQRLGRFLPPYRHRALALVREIHAPFVRPGSGIISHMDERLDGPLPDSGPGVLDVYLGLAVYSQFGSGSLAVEIDELEGMILRSYRSLAPDNGVDLGLLLWATHFFPGRRWAAVVRERALSALDARWVDPPGYFRRNLPEPWSRPVRPNPLAASNFSTAIGLQAQGLWSDRVHRIHKYFLAQRRADSGLNDPLTAILSCISLHPGLMLAD